MFVSDNAAVRPGIGGIVAWGPQVDENPLASQHARHTIIQPHLQGFGTNETACAHDLFSATGPVALQVQLDQASNHVGFACRTRAMATSESPVVISNLAAL